MTDINKQELLAQINKLLHEVRGRQETCTDDDAYNFSEGQISAYEEVTYLLKDSKPKE